MAPHPDPVAHAALVAALFLVLLGALVGGSLAAAGWRVYVGAREALARAERLEARTRLTLGHALKLIRRGTGR